MIHNIAIDMGTSGVRMAVKGRGVVYRQSAAIARRGDDLLEAGNEALRLLSRVPEDITVSFPMRGGTIADELALLAWLSYLIRHAQGAGLVHRPRLLLSVAPDVQPAPLRHVVATAMEAGASGCSVIRSDLCAAIGAPMDLFQPKGALVCQLGAGMMSVTAVAGGRVIAARALPFGMAQVDDAIIRRLRKAQGMIIGRKAAEDLKLSLVTAGAQAAPCQGVSAIDAASGFPKHFDVPADAVKGAAEPVLAPFFELIHQVLDVVPMELSADLAEAGMILTGGGAQLFGLAQRLAGEFSLACHLVEDPAAAVVRGLNQAMDGKDKYQAFITSHMDVMTRGTT